MPPHDQKRRDALSLEIKTKKGEYDTIKSKLHGSRSTEEIQTLMEEIESIKGLQARAQEVNVRS